MLSPSISSWDVTEGGGSFIYTNFVFDNLISPYPHTVFDFNIRILLSPINQQAISLTPRVAHFIIFVSKYFHSSLFSTFVSYLSFLRGKGLRFTGYSTNIIWCYKINGECRCGPESKKWIQGMLVQNHRVRNQSYKMIHFIFSKRKKIVYESDHNLCQQLIW